jgi:hypothetical protein
VHDDRAERVRRVHRLDDVEQVKEVLRELALRCYQETISVTSGPPTAEAQLADGLRYDLGLLDRGVRLRLLYTRSQLESEAVRRYVRTVAKAGAEVRVAGTLPHRLVVFDRAVSFLPVDPLRPSRGALVVREPAITANLVILFESLWAAAAEVDQALESGTSPTSWSGWVRPAASRPASRPSAAAGSERASTGQAATPRSAAGGLRVAGPVRVVRVGSAATWTR